MAYLDNCGWTAHSSGTGSFVDDVGALLGYQNMAAAGAVNSATYDYRAWSVDNTQWEIGYGVFTTATHTLTRATILFNSSGGTSAINFTLAPQVAIVATAEQLSALVISGGALGTPSSGTLTNCTGLPISTGVSNLGTGVATALGNNTNATGGVSITTTAPTSYAMTDVSGASLVFTSVNVYYRQIGNMVYVYGRLTYPVTADSLSAKVSLPVAVWAAASIPCALFQTGTLTGSPSLLAAAGNSYAFLIDADTGAQYQNVQMSGSTITFMLIYPAT